MGTPSRQVLETEDGQPAVIGLPSRYVPIATTFPGQDQKALIVGDPEIASEVAHRASSTSRYPIGLQPRKNIALRHYRAIAIAGFILSLAIWSAIAASSLIDPIFLPSPLVVFITLCHMLGNEMFWLDLGISFARVSVGFALSAVLAIPLGILIGSMKGVEAFLQPVHEFVRYIPVPALIPILIVMLGIGEASKWALIFIGTYFQLILMVADEVRRVPLELLQVAQTLGARRREIIRKVLAPAAMPGIFDALRVCNGLAWTYLVVAELIAANQGMGYRILKFSRYLQAPNIWAYLIALGIVGLFLDIVFRRFNQWAFRWAETAR